MKIIKEDIIIVNDVIEKKIKEKDVEERARKDRRNNMCHGVCELHARRPHLFAKFHHTVAMAAA